MHHFQRFLGHSQGRALDHFRRWFRGCPLFGHCPTFCFIVLPSELSHYTLENLAGEALTNLRLSNRCFGIQPTRRVCEKEMRKMVRRQISHFSKPLLNFENAESSNSFLWFLRNLQMFDTWMWQIWKNKMIPGSSPTELNPSIAPKQNDANLTPKNKPTNNWSLSLVN